MNAEDLEEIENELTTQLEGSRAEALALATPLSRGYSPGSRPLSVHQFHARIGRWNTTFVDSIRLRFGDPKEFLAPWIEGLLANVEAIEAEQRKVGTVSQDSSEHEVVRYLQQPQLRQYVFTFLERNFYRNFLERTREKPQEDLWQAWFGRGDMCWGLIIAPAFRKGAWTNDVSEIRRATYHYWTIGHVLATGLIDPNRQEPYRLRSLEDILGFYESILKRDSKSPYERGIVDRYAAYLRKSPDPEREPFLMPELRYEGAAVKHLHRLDFTVFNSHTMELTGFEFSPASTHMAIEGSVAEKKRQVDHNRELAGKWAKEMGKRNDYFARFGIPVVTFTDEQLKDMDACFARIASTLSARGAAPPNLKTALHKLDSYRFEVERPETRRGTFGIVSDDEKNDREEEFSDLLEHPTLQARIKRELELMLLGQAGRVDSPEGPLEGAMSYVSIGDIEFHGASRNGSDLTASFIAATDVVYDALNSEGEDVSEDHSGDTAGVITLTNVCGDLPDTLAETVGIELKIEERP